MKTNWWFVATGCAVCLLAATSGLSSLNLGGQIAKVIIAAVGVLLVFFGIAGTKSKASK